MVPSAGAHDCHPVGACASSESGGTNVKTWRTILGTALVWLIAAGTVWAQAVAGSQVSGVVKDSSGGVLPGVEVTITKTDTGSARTVFTGADGAYVGRLATDGRPPTAQPVVMAGSGLWLSDAGTLYSVTAR